MKCKSNYSIFIPSSFSQIDWVRRTFRRKALHISHSFFSPKAFHFASALRFAFLIIYYFGCFKNTYQSQNAKPWLQSSIELSTSMLNFCASYFKVMGWCLTFIFLAIFYVWYIPVLPFVAQVVLGIVMGIDALISITTCLITTLTDAADPSLKVGHDPENIKLPPGQHVIDENFYCAICEVVVYDSITFYSYPIVALRVSTVLCATNALEDSIITVNGLTTALGKRTTDLS